MLRSSRLVFLLGVLACTSCSPSSAPSSCAEGTELVDGVCVAPADAAIDAGTDTRVNTDTSAVETGTVIDTMTTDVGDAKITDAGFDAAGPEPCPPKIDFNCSTSCGGPTGNCAQLECGAPAPGYVMTSSTPRPIVLRTPDRPAAKASCYCAGAMPVTLYSLHMRVSLGVGDKVRVRVSAPWKIYSTSLAKPHCALSDLGQCAVLYDDSFISIGTTSPETAPARNVVMDIPATGDGCI